jgi:hypothetical protein
MRCLTAPAGSKKGHSSDDMGECVVRFELDRTIEIHDRRTVISEMKLRGASI